jgi:hypothetical protein
MEQLNWKEANGSAMPVSTISRCHSHVAMAGILRQLGDLAEYV